MMLLAAALFAAVSLPAPADKDLPDAYSFASVVSRKYVPQNAGPAPPFNAADYAPYWKTGTNTLKGTPFVRTSDGRTFPCGNGLYALIYPSTPYTRWMLNNFLYYVYSTNYFQDPADLVDAPSYLRETVHDPTLVHEADCANGTFSFPNLPSGKYSILTTIRVPASESHVIPSSENVYGPGGQVGTVYHNEISSSEYWGDGWILVTPILDVGPTGPLFTVGDNAWFTMAHISAGGRVPPKARGRS